MPSLLARFSRYALFLASARALAGCAGGHADPAREPRRAAEVTADLSELEIRATGVDRFTTCPPPGKLGQHWIPPIPSWTPPALSLDAGAPLSVDQDFIARTRDRTPTELAVEATHKELRSCYWQGLVHSPTQDGRVALVLRIGADGRTAKVESYAACELAAESIACMEGVAKKLRFPPPPGGSDTVTIPATFTSRDGVRRTVSTANDAYTAGAYVDIDKARPALHGCEDAARREMRPVQASGTFTLDVAGDGRVTKAHVDPWKGDRALLGCAATVLEGLRFAPPSGGGGTVVARLNFNPRQGTR